MVTSRAPSGPEPPRRRGRPGHDQASVLRAAVELFNHKGYDATSMGDLARELGVSKAALYHHVSGKQELLRQALDDALDELTAAVSRASQAGESSTADARLRAFLRHSVELLAAHRPTVTLLLRVRGNSAVEREALRRRRWVDDRVAELVADAVAEGSLRGDIPPDLVSRLLFGMVNSLVEWYRPDGAYDPASVADAVCAIALDGLTRPGARGDDGLHDHDELHDHDRLHDHEQVEGYERGV